MKASNSLDKTTLPGRLQLFRGIDVRGNYVADVTGLDDEEIEIPGAVRVERLLVPFWENGQHAAIPSIEKQKATVAEQRRRFADIKSYPRSLSERLRTLVEDLTAQMRADAAGEVAQVSRKLGDWAGEFPEIRISEGDDPVGFSRRARYTAGEIDGRLLGGDVTRVHDDEPVGTEAPRASRQRCSARGSR